MKCRTAIIKVLFNYFCVRFNFVACSLTSIFWITIPFWYTCHVCKLITELRGIGGQVVKIIDLFTIGHKSIRFDSRFPQVLRFSNTYPWIGVSLVSLLYLSVFTYSPPLSQVVIIYTINLTYILNFSSYYILHNKKEEIDHNKLLMFSIIHVFRCKTSSVLDIFY